MANIIRTTTWEALRKSIIEARVTAGMSQRDLVAKLGSHPSTVANIESGQRRIDVVEIVALARALGVTPQHFFDVVVRAVSDDELVGNFRRPSNTRAGRTLDR